MRTQRQHAILEIYQLALAAFPVRVAMAVRIRTRHASYRHMDQCSGCRGRIGWWR